MSDIIKGHAEHHGIYLVSCQFCGRETGPGQGMVCASCRAERPDLPPPRPEPLTLRCPACNRRHLDVGEWRTRPHRTHRCVDGPDGIGCSNEWRPFAYPTVGV
jgi:hypothetical protein